MSAERIPVSEYQPPEWVQDLSDDDRAAYETARNENIKELLPVIRTLLDSCLPGLSTTRPDEFEATVVRWTTSCRNNYEAGIQDGKDAWGNQHDDYARSFMRNTLGNWAG